ncbi:MAG: hypothetical protein ACPG31_10780 [Planctomycetota bacterium]
MEFESDATKIAGENPTERHDGLTFRGFPSAEILVGSQSFTIQLDASQANFTASTTVRDLALRGIGNNGTGVLLEGGGRMSARFLNLQFEALAYGVKWFATGPTPAVSGSSARSFGSGGGGGDLPGTKGIQIAMPAHMLLELEITGNTFTDFLTGVWVEAPWGAGFLVSGNSYTDVSTHEVLLNTTP